MGHCGEFGYMLWATAANLVIRYGPPRRDWLCVMATARNEVVQLKSVTVSILWAIAQDLVCLLGHSAGFCCALWAIAQDLVIRFGP